MTVSTIANVSADLKRVAEQQNKQADTAQPGAKALPQTATLPVDSVADSAIRNENLDREAATLATEAQNREAAQAVLSDDDLDALGGASAQEKIQATAKAALAAQTNKLPANILSVLAE